MGENSQNSLNISITDLGIAYRKAKSDIFYSSQQKKHALVEYENNLAANLTRLHTFICSTDYEWTNDPEYIGSYSFAPTGYKHSASGTENTTEHNAAKVIKYSNQSTDDISNRDTATFRLMSDCSIDMHIVSAYWISQIGEKLDLTLSEDAYANRVRRNRDNKYNELASGIFDRYLTPYGKWRDRPVEAVKKIQDSGKPAIAISFDVESFYHSIDPKKILADETIEKMLKRELSSAEIHINKIMRNSICAWSNSTNAKLHESQSQNLEDCPQNPGTSERRHAGLPVGLAASSILANITLSELDESIEYEIRPEFYGRYCDDMILVIRGHHQLSDYNSVWDWIYDRIWKNIRKIAKQPSNSSQTTHSISVRPIYVPYPEGKNDASHDEEYLIISDLKSKIFFFEGSYGKSVAKTLVRSARQSSSEWRLAPTIVGRNTVDILSDIVSMFDSAGNPATSLSKSSEPMTKRSRYALQLRDIEAISKYVEPSSWKEIRSEFYEASFDHAFKQNNVLSLARYLPRVFTLMGDNDDYDDMEEMFSKLAATLIALKDNPNKVVIKGFYGSKTDDVFDLWASALFSQIADSILSSKSCVQNNELAIESMQGFKSKIRGRFPDTVLSLLDRNTDFSDYFRFDLASVPFYDAIAPESSSLLEWHKVDLTKGFVGRAPSTVLHPSILKDIASFLYSCDTNGRLLSIARGGNSNGIIFPISGFSFPTRPVPISHIFSWTRAFSRFPKTDTINDWLRSIRGFRLSELTSTFDMAYPSEGISIPWRRGKRGLESVRIGLVSWKNSSDTFKASALQSSDRSFKRFCRLCNIVNEVLRSGDALPDYVVFPELAVPPAWFNFISEKLGRSGVSVISGVEYIRNHDSRRVSNQVWASFVNDMLPFPSLAIYRQDKQIPSPGEEATLKSLGDLELAFPQEKDSWSTPPIINHGGLFFAILNCMELTDIRYRSALKGKVDAVFIPEWNRDITTYDSLVRSTASDLHCYIIQVNDRTYGDSRLRGPYKEDYARDNVRMKGGLNDHFIIGSFNVNSLRTFQSEYRSQKGVFKPTPANFWSSIPPNRRRL